MMPNSRTEVYSEEKNAAYQTPAGADDARARKRQAVGLSPARPTARGTIQRPPRAHSDRHLRRLPFLVALLALATALLIFATIRGWPTRLPDVRAALQSGFTYDAQDEAIALSYDLPAGSPYHRLAEMNFSTARGGLAEESLPQQYEIWTDEDTGAYRMRVWPDNLAWSVLGKSCLGPYRTETSAIIAADAPDAYAGLLGRFQNTQNFYLFVIDGRGNYRALAQVEGAWQTLQPWTQAPALLPAGQANKIALQDDGRTLNFLGNDTLLYGVSDLALPAGNTGLVGGARDVVADIAFDWLRLYDLPCRAE